MTIKNIVAYLRSDIGEEIKQQRDELERYAKQEKIHVEKYFVDEGYSGSDLNRPGIQALLSDIKMGTVKTVLVDRPDRIVQSYLLKQSIEKVFELYNVKTIVVDGGDELVQHKIVSDIIAVWHDWEKNKKSTETIKGMAVSAAKGNWPYGRTPAGYKKVRNEELGKGSKIVPDEETAPIVVKIFEDLATNQQTVSDYLKTMNRDHILGKRWSTQMLYNMIDNEIYYGRFHAEWYVQDNHSPALISKDLWEMTQAAVHHNKHHVFHVYFFDKLMFDAEKKKFMTNECVLKTVRRTGEKTLYKYYRGPEKEYRIPEKTVVIQFLRSIKEEERALVDIKEIEQLKQKIENQQIYLKQLNLDFSRLLIDKDHYLEEREKTLKTIAKLKKQIGEFEDVSNEEFHTFSAAKKRAIVRSLIQRVDYYPSENRFDFIRKSKSAKKK